MDPLHEFDKNLTIILMKVCDKPMTPATPGFVLNEIKAACCKLAKRLKVDVPEDVLNQGVLVMPPPPGKDALVIAFSLKLSDLLDLDERGVRWEFSHSQLN